MTTNLTPVQKNALRTVSVGGDQSTLSERTLKALDSRGLITLDMDAYIATDAAQAYWERIGEIDSIRAEIMGTNVENTGIDPAPAPSKVDDVQATPTRPKGKSKTAKAQERFEKDQADRAAKEAVDSDEEIDFTQWTDRQLEVGARHASGSKHGDALLQELANRKKATKEAAPAPEKPAKDKTKATTPRKPVKRAMGSDGVLRKRIAPQLIAQFTKGGVQADVWNALQAEERESDGAVWLPVNVARLTKLLPVVEAIGANTDLDGGTRRAAKAFVKRVNAHHLPLARKAQG